MQPELDLLNLPLRPLSFSSSSFHFEELFVGSYLCPPLESSQFNGRRTLCEARKGSGEIVNRIHLGAVHIKLYGASPSLQIAQFQ